MHTDPAPRIPSRPPLSPERAAERERVERRLREGAPRQARAARTHDLRQWVAAGATALFLLVAGGLYANQPSGTSSASAGASAPATTTVKATSTASAPTTAPPANATPPSGASAPSTTGVSSDTSATSSTGTSSATSATSSTNTATAAPSTHSS